ncbi:ABC transporter ATP-binding protein [Micrococcales bacterium 31B]|nr:ABC transporter ATP-binding protein [Micrococcales bacterium 31B]
MPRRNAPAEPAAPLTRTPGALVVSKVSKHIDDNWLLHPTSLTATAGQCVAVRGHNGAGKSTFLRIVAGQIEPSGGHVTWKGDVVDERNDSQRRAIGCYIDPPATYSDLTLIDHLSLLAGTWGVAGHKSHPAALAVLERFEIAGLAARFPHELSSGQGQLFYLALAFMMPRDVLILDEPEQRLDSHKRDILAASIRAACADGALVIMASHSEDLVSATAHQVLDLQLHD